MSGLAQALRAGGAALRDRGTSPEREHVQKIEDPVALERAQNERLRACDLERWYDSLEKHTFRTVTVALLPAEAEALVALYWLKKKAEEGEVVDIQKQQPDPAQLAALEALRARIAAGVAELSCAGGVFAKLSSRSPKDSRMCEKRAFEMVKTRLSALRDAQGAAAVDTNAVYAAVLGCGISALRLSTAEEIVECFSTSDRVCEDDIPLALSFPDQWSQHIVLREVRPRRRIL
jgi:hypothetical protein